MNFFFRLLAVGVSALVLSSCSVAHVSNFQFDVSPSPEVRGAGTNMNSGDAMLRAQVSVVAPDEDKVTMPVRSRALDESLQSRLVGTALSSVGIDSVGKFETNNAIIKIDGLHVAGSIDFIFKFNTIFFELGVGAYDGAYYYASIGANHKYWEWGLFVGDFLQFTTVDYFGYWCSVKGCTEEDLDDSFEASEWVILSDAFLGGYVGVHWWRLSLNNTISFYIPGLDVAQLDYDMPAVISNYTSLGVRLGDSWTVRGGTVVSLIRRISKPHFGLKFSIDYSIGGTGPAKKSENKPVRQFDSPSESGADAEVEKQPETKPEETDTDVEEQAETEQEEPDATTDGVDETPEPVPDEPTEN